MKILIMGLPGSGKTVQARKIAQELGFCLIKTGEILRELSKIDTKEGKIIKNVLENGELVDDMVVGEIVMNRLQNPDCKNGFVVDGYPRSESQLKNFNPGFDKVIYLDIPENQAIKRLIERGRGDDTKRLITKRLAIQKKELDGLLKYYGSAGNLLEIDATKTIDEVFKDIVDHII